MAPERVGPEVTEVPVLFLDETGERAGEDKAAVAQHLAIGLWPASGRREGVPGGSSAGRHRGRGLVGHGRALAGVRPGLILVEGEEELSALAGERFAGVPAQRCLWHRSRVRLPGGPLP